MRESERVRRLEEVAMAFGELARGACKARRELFPSDKSPCGWSSQMAQRLRRDGLIELVGWGHHATYRAASDDARAALGVLADDRVKLAKVMWPGMTNQDIQADDVAGAQHPDDVTTATPEEKPNGTPDDGQVGETTLKIVAALMEHVVALNAKVDELRKETDECLTILKRLL